MRHEPQGRARHAFRLALVRVKRALPLALAPAFLSASPACAADIKTIDCVRDSLAPAVIAAIRQDAESLFTSASATMSEDNKAQIQAAGIKCAATYHWSDAATASALKHMKAVLVTPMIETKIRADGNDPALIERLVREMPAAQREAIRTQQNSETAMSALVEKLQQAKVALTSSEQQGDVGLLVGAILNDDDALSNFTRA